MKKLMMLFAIVALTLSVNARNVEPPAKNKTPVPQEEQTSLLMRNDTVWLRKGAKETVLDKEIKMGNATVTPRGRVTLKSGLIVDLKEGDVMLQDGKILTAPGKK